MFNDPTKHLTDAAKIYNVKLAKWLNKIFEGKLKPSHIKIISLLGHIPIAWALIDGQLILAAVLLAIFSSMHPLYEAFARVQKSTKNRDKHFDLVTIQIKELILYIGLGLYVENYIQGSSFWLVFALASSSLLVNHLKAKSRDSTQGISRYEIRMILIVLAMLSGILTPILRLIIALNLFTLAVLLSEIYNTPKSSNK